MQRKLVFLLFTLILLTSCAPRASTTPAPEVPTSTPVPTASATPISAPLTILVLPADMDRAESDQYQTRL